MLFSNPVDPSQAIRIHYQSPSGPAVAYPRDDERGLDGTLKLLAAAALLATGYVIGGFAVASVPAAAPVPVEVDGGIGGPVSKVGSPVRLDPVPGEFRLGPGNNDAPGIVVPVALPKPNPGDFRLSPGNLPPVGITGQSVNLDPVPGEFRLGPGNNDVPGVVVPLSEVAPYPDDLHGLFDN